MLLSQGEVILCLLKGKIQQPGLNGHLSLIARLENKEARGKVGVFLPFSCRQYTTRDAEV